MAGGLGREPGGIRQLLVLIEEHRGAIEYDFRNRLHVGLSEVGVSIEMDEAIRLVRVLRSDPGTQLAAAVENWEYPIERGTAVVMDLYDLEHAKAGVRNPKPYPRGWKVEHGKTRRGNRGDRSNAQVLDLVRPAVQLVKSEQR